MFGLVGLVLPLRRTYLFTLLYYSIRGGDGGISTLDLDLAGRSLENSGVESEWCDDKAM
jgi:hypothetical protein